MLHSRSIQPDGFSTKLRYKPLSLTVHRMRLSLSGYQSRKLDLICRDLAARAFPSERETAMPVYMDRHYVEDATRHAVADEHQKDLELQDKYKIQFLNYWFDEVRSTAFCLIEAPDRRTIERAHKEAHGLIPNEVIEVDPAVVNSFLGRIKDPPATAPGKSEAVPIDPGFRAIMFTDLKDSTLMTTLYGDR